MYKVKKSQYSNKITVTGINGQSSKCAPRAQGDRSRVKERPSKWGVGFYCPGACHLLCVNKTKYERNFGRHSPPLLHPLLPSFLPFPSPDLHLCKSGINLRNYIIFLFLFHHIWSINFCRPLLRSLLNSALDVIYFKQSVHDQKLKCFLVCSCDY